MFKKFYTKGAVLTGLKYANTCATSAKKKISVDSLKNAFKNFILFLELYLLSFEKSDYVSFDSKE